VAKRKPKLNITIPINFVPLRKAGGWYYTKKFKGKKPAHSIEVDANSETFDKIELLYHELTHAIYDYVNEIAATAMNLKKGNIKNNKVIAIKPLTDNQEETMCYAVARVAVKQIKKMLMRPK